MAFTLSTEYEALKHDVNTLFSRFYQKQSVRFEDFATEWKAMSFNCIFAATYRTTISAKTRIVERLLRVASEFLSEESTFLYRVAAVYMFYAVYFRQLTECKVKIRMTPTMWKDLIDFMNIVIEHQHLDVAYVIQVLRKHKAFVFTAFPKFLLFGRHEFMLGIEGVSNLRHTYEGDAYINDFFKKNELVETLSTIQSDYDEVKEKILQESKEEEREYLSQVLYYSNSQFPQELKKMIDANRERHKKGSSLKPHQTFDNIQRPVLSQLQDLHAAIPLENENADKAPSRAQMISEIKEKSWKSSVSSKLHKGSIKTDSLEEDHGDIEAGNIIYKKSAMLQPMVRQKKKQVLKSKSIRYRMLTKSNIDVQSDEDY